MNWFWGWTLPVNWPSCITIHVGVSGAVVSLLHQVTKLGVSFRQQNDIAVIDIFNEKRKSCNHRCPDSVYFHTLLLIIYFSAIERLICRREMSITIHIGVSGAVASLLCQVTKLGVSFRQQNDIAVIDIFNEKRKSCNHRCPDSVYFHTLLLIIYFSVIERLICRREMNLIGSTSFGFAQNMIHDFQNTVLNS